MICEHCGKPLGTAKWHLCVPRHTVPGTPRPESMRPLDGLRATLAILHPNKVDTSNKVDISNNKVDSAVRNKVDTPKRGRPMVGDRPLTAAEKKRRYRDRLKQEASDG